MLSEHLKKWCEVQIRNLLENKPDTGLNTYNKGKVDTYQQIIDMVSTVPAKP